MKIILKLSKLALLLYHFDLLFLHGEGVNAALSVLGLVLLKPVVLSLNIFPAVGTPSWDPVVGNGVENETGALLANGKAFFLTELLPFSLGLFLRGRFLPRGHDFGLREVNTPESLSVFKDLTVLPSGLSLLLSLQVE